MNSKSFEAAAWGFSWDDINNDFKSCAKGTAEFDADSGVSLDLPFDQILADSSFRVVSSEYELPKRSDWLYGLSQSGQRLAIRNAYSSGLNWTIPGGPHQVIGGTCLLSGNDVFNPNAPVREVVLQLNGLRHWFGKAPITAKEFPNGDLQINASLRDQSNNEVLLDNSELGIEVTHDFRGSGPSVAGVDILHDCVLGVSFKNPCSLNRAVEVAMNIADFFSFCCGFFVEIEDLGLRFEATDGLVSCYKPIVRGNGPRNVQLSHIPFSYSFLGDNLPVVLNAWVSADDKLSPSLTMMVSLMFRSWKLPADSQFIAASQLLEAISKYQADLESLPKEDFNRYRAELEKAIASIDNKAAREWVEVHRPGNQKGQKKLLEELLAHHKTISDWLLGDGGSFVKAQVDMRNRLTHRGARKRNGRSDWENLHWLTEIDLLLCYCIVGDILGIDPPKIVKAIERTGFKSGVRLQVRQLFLE